MTTCRFNYSFNQKIHEGKNTSQKLTYNTRLTLINGNILQMWKMLYKTQTSYKTANSKELLNSLIRM